GVGVGRQQAGRPVTPRTHSGDVARARLDPHQVVPELGKLGFRASGARLADGDDPHDCGYSDHDAEYAQHRAELVPRYRPDRLDPEESRHYSEVRLHRGRHDDCSLPPRVVYFTPAPAITAAATEATGSSVYAYGGMNAGGLTL